MKETLHKVVLSGGDPNHITITTRPSANNVEIVTIESIQKKVYLHDS